MAECYAATYGRHRDAHRCVEPASRRRSRQPQLGDPSAPRMFGPAVLDLRSEHGRTD